MMKIVIVYASRYGFTENAATDLARQVGGEAYNLEQGQPDLAGVTVLVVGTPMAVGEPHPAVKLFLREVAATGEAISQIHFFVSGGRAAVLAQTAAWVPPALRSKLGRTAWCGGAVDLKRVSLVGKLILLLAGKFKNYRIVNPGWMESLFPVYQDPAGSQSQPGQST